MPFNAALWSSRQAGNMLTSTETLRWFRRERCSCFDQQNQNWDRAHSPCSGTGEILVEQTITGYNAIVSAAPAKLEMQTGGRILASDLRIETDPDEIPLSLDDEIILQGTRRRLRFEEVLRRGIDDTTFHPLLAIERVRRGDTIYTVTTDYAFVVDAQTITWVAGRGPSTGQTYSVMYWGRPRYKIHDILRRGDTAPTQCVVGRLLNADELRQGVAG